jgi:hypothetical protein
LVRLGLLWLAGVLTVGAVQALFPRWLPGLSLERRLAIVTAGFLSAAVGALWVIQRHDRRAKHRAQHRPG